MKNDRMLAFTDGVIAVIITIMVLDLKIPHQATFAALRPEAATFVTYVVSFIYVGIYWNNHHHMFVMADRTNGGILWANLIFLFWLSLVPFVTGWLGQSGVVGPPAATYAFVLLMCAISFTILQTKIIKHQGEESELQKAIGTDHKGRFSLLLYVAAIISSFFLPVLSVILTSIPAAIWFIPDPRIESRIGDGSR